MISEFNYRVHSRAMWSWPGLAAGLIMLALASHTGAPGWVWAMLLPCLAICLLQIAFRPIYGIRISPAMLEVFSGFTEYVLPLTHIAYLSISATQARIVMHSGTEISLPQRALPNSLCLIAEMTARDIPVRQI